MRIICYIYTTKSNSMKRLLLSFAVISTITTFSQNRLSLNDSLIGFDGQSIINSAAFKGITPLEMPVYIAINKREFINQKYDLRSVAPKIDYGNVAKTAAAACVNEDFEEASLIYSVPSNVVISTSNAINGWVINGGSNSTWGATGNCTNTSFMTGPPNPVMLIGPGAAGLIDPIIGASYPIYSVFGDTTVNYPASYAANGFKCYGDWFIQLNNSTPGSSVNQIRKTFVVSPSNVIFNFAYIAIANNGHCCCDNGAVSIIFKDCLGNMLASASQFSITAPANLGCTPTGNCSSPSTITSVPAASSGFYFNKWANSSIDLTTWMGQCITVQVTTVDCPYSGHAGYAYFDAQCAPTVVTGINSVSNKVYYKIYPNPNAGNFNIEINKEINNGEIELRNILGQTVHKQNIKQGSNQIKTENLAKGIYSYSVLQNKEIVSIGKIVIE